MKNCGPLICVIILLYFAFAWSFKLNVLPGLHGDEAWAGLEAYKFSTSGVGRLIGMNNYTGVLQPLASSFIFEIFDVGVLQLRLPGVIFNLIGLMVICGAFLTCGLRKPLLLFILIMAQSALFLVSPRIAWEVNTFTLFFLSILVASAARIVLSPDRYMPFWAFFFLAAHLIGTYNHIIFSTVGVAGLLGIVLWNAYNRNMPTRYVISLLTLNLFNAILVFLAMRYILDGSFSTFIGWVVIASFFLIVTAEALSVRKLSTIRWPMYQLRASRVRTVIHGVLGLLVVYFSWFHGLALFDALANYKSFIHIYSIRFSPALTIVFQISGGLLLFFAFYELWEDIRSNTPSPLAFIIIAYLGVLPFYTTNNSLRYYLIVYVLFAMYLAVRYNRRGFRRSALVLCLMVSLVLTNIFQIRALICRNRPIAPVTFTVGNRQQETSAHFLPSKPLIDFLKRRRIGGIYYLHSRYFLEQPILFHYLIAPWKRELSHTAIVGYDGSGGDGGYLLISGE